MFNACKTELYARHKKRKHNKIAMSFEEEFGTVEIILNSTLETRGVDAFILSLIKAEKQLRRIFTFLIFQNDSYTISDFRNLRKTLADNRNVYFNFVVQEIY